MIELVAGAATGYNAEQIRPFLKSLRDSGYANEILLFVDGGAAEEAAKWDVEIRECPPFKGVPHAARFHWLNSAVQESTAKSVLLADTRDVFFQSNLNDVPGTGLHAFEEDARMTLGSCPYNAKWLRQGYGIEAIVELGSYPISCVGTVCGGTNEVKEYLKLLAEELERIQPLTNMPQDQAVHNHLIRRVLNPTIWDNEAGVVYTVGYIPRGTVDVDTAIRNKANRAPAVVHQWERHKNLTTFVVGRTT